MVKKLKTRRFSRMYLKTSALPSHLSLPTPIPATANQKERHYQGSGNKLMMPLASQKVSGTTPIRNQERLGGLLKYHSGEAA